MIKQEELLAIYKEACICDVQAFKPGNVSVYNEGHDMTVDDFILSAEVSASEIVNAEHSLGEKIYYAVKATREAVGCNTNLGIILLCAPLCQAAYVQKKGQTLRESLVQVLANTTIADAEWTFKAITLAAPGGLGESNEQDVGDVAAVSLVEAMEIASEKDRIAKQYTTSYKDIFEFSVLRYNDAYVKFDSREWAASAVFTALLSKFPDSHIERKYGDKYSEWVLKQMITVDDALMDAENPKLLLPTLFDVDRKLKDKKINPGTTADLTVATVLVILMEAFSVR